MSNIISLHILFVVGGTTMAQPSPAPWQKNTMQNIINWGSSTLGDALWPEPALEGARWSPQNDFNETLYANIVCIYIQTYTCVTVSYMYAWLFVQRANKVNNRFMSLLKKDNRWVATAFYFTFFPPPWHSPSHRPCCCWLCCILWLSLRLFLWGKGRDQTPSSSVLRVRVAFM